MTDRDALLALADRVEACTGPDREIDNAIWDAVYRGPPLECFCTGACNPISPNYLGACVVVPHYTDSIDAAMTLVPDGLSPTIDFVTHRCWLRTAEGYDVFHGPAYGFGRHVPTSIAAASLRALAGEWG